MSRLPIKLPVALACLAAAALPAFAQEQANEPTLSDLMAQATRAAVARVAPSLVQIETSGGTDVITSGPRGETKVRKGYGPTTGVVVAADGYVISSAFNFANKPSGIFVAVPGHKERYVAKVVATDQTRMVTLLKIEAMGLPVPAAAPKKDFKVGQTALAMGRTLDGIDRPPSVGVGILSALERIWGKAVQTDAKTSPANYGGALADLDGRVVGVIVPASPRSEGETAGVEWYDSGIGFAMPFEDVLAVLPRLKQGKDLKKGLLGITVQNPNDLFGVPPVISTVAPDSGAANAGIKPGDKIVEVDGKPVDNFSKVLHILGSKYDGDAVAVKVRRDKETVTFEKVVLTGTLAAHGQPFFGILPMRDDPEPGLEIRYVYPKSPAEAAGLKAGDRLMKIAPAQGGAAPQPFAGRDRLAAVVNSARPGTEFKFEVNRKGGKTETVTVKLAEAPDAVPEKLPLEGSNKKARQAPKGAPGGAEPKKDDEKKDDDKKPETDLIKRTSADGEHKYWVYVPRDYDPNISYALLVWLHPAGKSKDADVEDFVDAWKGYCTDNRVIMVGPKAEGEAGWMASESDFVREAVTFVTGTYTIDRGRVVAHGMGVGGQMSFYMGFQARDLVRGVATTGAVLTGNPKDKVANQPLSFFLVAGSKDPIAKAIAESKGKIAEKKYPVVFREIADMGHQYLDEKTLDELVRWIDSLDRI